MSSYSIAAIKARMGSTPYYQAVMRADQLAATVGAAMDFPEFKSFMAHEQMQRKMNESRVEKEIVPYLTHSPDRFFGSIIVLAYRTETFEFESIRELSGSRLKGSAYEGKDDQLGVLTIGGGTLFALDGQHRLHALRTIVKGGETPHLKLPIEGEYKDVVAGDQLSVIFLQYESVEKARRIFNKVALLFCLDTRVFFFDTIFVILAVNLSNYVANEFFRRTLNRPFVGSLVRFVESVILSITGETDVD